MSDGSFVILSQGKTIYEGGDNKSGLFSRRNRRSVKNSGTVIYPIFKLAIKYAEDDLFWIKILDDASEGVFPKTHRYKDGILSCKKRNKYFTKEISQDNPLLCLQNIQDFMKDNGFYSTRDNTLKLEEIDNLREEESKKDIQWSKIRSNKIKKILVSNYISYLQRKYSLSNIEQSDLINKIRLATSSGLINKNSVVMENKQITNITILCYDARHRDFFIDPNVKSPKISKSASKKIKEELQDDDEMPETPTIKLNGLNISKSRITDWGKFTTILGKRLATHGSLERFVVEEEEEAESPIKIRKKKRPIITLKSSTS